MLCIPLALTTGNDGWDLVVAMLAAVFGGGGVVKGSSIARRAVNAYHKVVNFDARLTVVEKCFADLKRRQSDHEENDEVRAMEYMGFVEVGENAVIVADGKGRTIMISPALARMMGLSIEEAVNGAWKDVIHPEDRQATLIKWEGFVNGALSHLTLKFRLQTQSGRIEPLTMKIVRKKIVQGGVSRIVGLVWREGTEPPKPPETLSI